MLQMYTPLQAAEDITTGAASAQSSAAPPRTTHARICATAACRYLIGANPTALAASTYLPAGVVEFIPCAAGLKVAAIQEAAAGKLNVTFCDGM